MQRIKKSSSRLFFVVFILLVILSLVPTIKESRNSFSHSSCKAGSVFCSEPGEKTLASNTTIKGKGFPFMAITTEKFIITNGQTTRSTQLQVAWIAAVADLIIVGLASLLIARLIVSRKTLTGKKAALAMNAKPRRKS
jgi:hypothetical protein